ncbi:MAG TPA: NTP transferase domain-containing protein [Anaerohalosphaeraceae bacterium]|nr:NTP transferase domain-containing protein [Anaerohalosphaeraceae bacterium]
MTVQITAIIPAAGQGQRWNRAFGTLKQLVPVDKSRQPLLLRTIQMLRDRGVGSIYVLTKDPEIEKTAAEVAEILPPSADRYLSDTMLSSRSLWSEKTIVLLGDVYFSSFCIDSILRNGPEYCFWGVGHGSEVCRKNFRRPELFAFSFSDSAHSEVEKNLKINSLLAELRGKGRMFWRVFGCGWELFGPFFRQNYSPKPSHWFRDRGFRGNDFWRVYRCWQRKQPVYAYQYGKLWGLYRLLGNVDPFGGLDYTWPQDQSGHFVQVEDQTQDIDSPEDFQRLCQLWNGTAQGTNRIEETLTG